MPGGLFVWKMIGNALRVALNHFFTGGAEKANDNALRSAALPKEAALQMQFTIATLLVKMVERNARRRSVLPKSRRIFP